MKRPPDEVSQLTFADIFGSSSQVHSKQPPVIRFAERDTATTSEASADAIADAAAQAADREVISPDEKPAAAPRVWSVSALLGELRGEVEARYRQLTVEGEISNWRRAASGHCYFTLKDAGAQISVVLFRRGASLLRFAPKDGDSVRLRGDMSVYEARGQMQIVATSMTLAGIGAMLQAVQELKERLRTEGLFARKRQLPAFPRSIGVVTSTEGAALRDVVKVCRRRHAAVNLLVYPVAVQGPRSSEEVAAAVRWFSDHPDRADVVLVVRGGGSWEDLHGFDDEKVVRAIAACSVPVIAGIGHATDTVLADAAADVCAPTPSAAAELVTAAQHQVELRVSSLATRLQRAMRFEAVSRRAHFNALNVEIALERVRAGVHRRAQYIDEMEARAADALGRLFAARADRARTLHTRLLLQDADRRIGAMQARQAHLAQRLERAGAAITGDAARRLQQMSARAEAMSPLRVLDRGYSLVFDGEGRLLTNAADTRQGDTITARLARGTLRARVG